MAPNNRLAGPLTSIPILALLLLHLFALPVLAKGKKGGGGGGGSAEEDAGMALTPTWALMLAPAVLMALGGLAPRRA